MTRRRLIPTTHAVTPADAPPIATTLRRPVPVPVPVTTTGTAADDEVPTTTATTSCQPTTPAIAYPLLPTVNDDETLWKVNHRSLPLTEAVTGGRAGVNLVPGVTTAGGDGTLTLVGDDRSLQTDSKVHPAAVAATTTRTAATMLAMGMIGGEITTTAVSVTLDTMKCTGGGGGHMTAGTTGTTGTTVVSLSSGKTSEVGGSEIGTIVAFMSEKSKAKVVPEIGGSGGGRAGATAHRTT
jgi:hypothetical protein